MSSAEVAKLELGMILKDYSSVSALPGETEDKCTRQKTRTSFVLNVSTICLILQGLVQ